MHVAIASNLVLYIRCSGDKLYLIKLMRMKIVMFGSYDANNIPAQLIIVKPILNKICINL